MILVSIFVSGVFCFGFYNPLTQYGVELHPPFGWRSYKKHVVYLLGPTTLNQIVKQQSLHPKLERPKPLEPLAWIF